MPRFKHNLSMHWPLAVGVLLLIPTVWKYWSPRSFQLLARGIPRPSWFALGTARQ
jgi:hypothetical protein